MTAHGIFPLALERHTLRNGLRVVIHRDRRLPLVTVNLWYHVGSKNERPGRTGFAHLFEHLLFEGSEHVPQSEHFRLVQEAGGVANGSTWYDRTNYYETLPSHHLDLGLWLESDRMGFFLPAITQDKLDNQRDVVLNERRQRVDNQPYGQASERLHELLYPEAHPYRWPVLGYPDDVRSATLGDVSRFFSTYYVPNNAVLTIAGDVDPPAVLDRVERYFGDIPAAGSIPAPSIPTAEIAGVARETIPDRVRLSRVYMAFHGPPYGREAWYAGDLWATAMSSGKSSVLYRDLVYDRQLAQDVACYLYPTEECASVVVVATARPGVEIERLDAALDAHLAESARTALDDANVTSARNALLTGHYRSLQSLERRADLLSRFTTYFDDPAAMADEGTRYERLDGADLTAFAAEHCALDRRVVVTVVPS